MHIAHATPADAADRARLRSALFPDDTSAEHRDEVDAALASPDPESYNLIARTSSGDAIAFAEARLRHDYVNGCDASPVVFLEAIYVVPDQRRTGVARALCDRIAHWAGSRECTEFASDAPLDNPASHAFHRAVGFAETERVVYFRRVLDAPHG